MIMSWLCGFSFSAAAELGFKHGEWPFSPLERPTTPEVNHKDWVRNPIDNFILAELEKKGLEPNPRADKLTLLRRVTFDLTGLAPTPDEQQAFLADESADAYGRIVDRLLGSLRYGERWAQHWLDVVRYAETAGFKKDDLRPVAYKYRDYVIKALNADLPYNRFISQQLAGDELEPDNPEALIATGLSRLYPEETNASNFRLGRQEILDDITDITGVTFLGLTIGCAKCHDHKFDPIRQVDFYRLQAFFTPMIARDDVPAATPQERDEYDRRLAAWEAATKDLRAQIDALLAAKREAALAEALEPFDADTQKAVRTPAEQRSSLDKQLASLAMSTVQRSIDSVPKYLEGELKHKYEELATKLAALEPLRPAPLPSTMSITDAGPLAPSTFRLATGNYQKPLEEVGPGFPLFLGLSEPDIHPATLRRSQTTGRRSALAQWLCRPDHPLTTRVMVNRLWQHHFGEGIIASPNDFGAMGDDPTHPRLLDWLASEFVSRGWSMKAMHRLILTSATYCQSTSVDPKNPRHVQAQVADPANHLLWHGRRKRLEAEAIRDLLLQMAGQLNLRMYGPSARPELPQSLMVSRYAWDPDSKQQDRNRRSVYVFARRNMRYPMLGAFDPPDMINSCARRSTTTTAPQALTLLNGDFAAAQSRFWAGVLTSQPSSDAGLIEAAYVQAYGRRPGADEIQAAERFLALQSEKIAAAGEIAPSSLPEPVPPDVWPAKAAAIVDFCHALLNSTELLYID